MNVTLRQIEVFVVVARELHFGNAARKLNVTQATASQEVKRLELTLGLRLLQRSTRSVSLTPAGHVILKESEEVLSAASQLVDRATLFRDENLRQLRVAASPSVVNRLLPDAISSAETQIPGVHIEEIAVDSGDVTSTVTLRGADIGIGRFLSTPIGFTHELLGHEELIVVLSTEHHLASGQAVTLPDLGELPLLMWPREQAPRYYDAVLEICRSQDYSPLILVSPPRIVGSRLYLIAESRAFSLVPKSIEAFLPTGVTSVALQDRATLPLEMIYRSNDPRESATAFVSVIRTVAKRLLASA
ncbi:LysR substrate-binding domain-containing protein [Mycetocola sp.]|uniref:LysR substrate-binding domain-containing protein n=1 Tax=Mycetocola sp. TaxID=1871042 RepID=UPI00398928DA